MKCCQSSVPFPTKLVFRPSTRFCSLWNVVNSFSAFVSFSCCEALVASRALIVDSFFLIPIHQLFGRRRLHLLQRHQFSLPFLEVFVGCLFSFEYCLVLCLLRPKLLLKIRLLSFKLGLITRNRFNIRIACGSELRFVSLESFVLSDDLLRGIDRPRNSTGEARPPIDRWHLTYPGEATDLDSLYSLFVIRRHYGLR